MSPKIGVLALQGDVREHASALISLGATVQEVRQRKDLDGLDGIVLPGGESTTVSMLLDSSGVREPLGELLESGLPVFGTCAGLILLAARIEDGRVDQRSYGCLDITVRRNGYGAQLFSFEAPATLATEKTHPMEAIFIRAPVITQVGEGVTVVASIKNGEESQVVAVAHRHCLGATFHPELTDDRRLHARFLTMVADAQGVKR